MTIAPGIHTMPAKQYHADPCDQPSLTASVAHLLVNQTPLHAWAAHPKLNPERVREEKATFDIGTVVHELVLERSADRVHVIEADSWRSKAAQEERDDARARRLIPLLQKDWERVEAMTTSIWAQLDARNDDPPLFSDGKPEQTLVWEEDGVSCRARLDWLRDDFTTIDDLKTTGRSANPIEWGKRTLFGIGADIQVALYLRGLKHVTGSDAEFRYLLAESVPPFATAVVSLDSSALELGRAKVSRAIEKWRECLQTGRWPGYPSSVYYVETPAYEELRWLEQDGEALAA